MQLWLRDEQINILQKPDYQISQKSTCEAQAEGGRLIVLKIFFIVLKKSKLSFRWQNACDRFISKVLNMLII